MPKQVEITPEVRAVLERGEWRGWLFVLPPGQLDRKLYEAVNKVLVALGGKWSRSAGGHMFSLDAKPALVEALASGVAVDQKRTAEQFYTPIDLARRMADLLGLPSRDIRHILEPSAGTGRLVQAAMEHGVEFITVVERDPALATGLADMIGEHHGGIWVTDFLEWMPVARLPIDAVMMNPPFSGNQDIRHVLHAFGWLRPGGKLVAIMSPHFTYAADAPSKRFRELIGFPPRENGPPERWGGCGRSAQVADAEVQLLPGGTFKAEGTNVSAVLVSIEKGR